MKKNDLVKVTLKKGTVFGKVVDVSGELNDIIYVMVGNDIMKFYQGAQTVEVISVHEYHVLAVEKFLDDNEIVYHGFSGDGLVEYLIEGCTYNVGLSIEEGQDFHLDTTHNDRYRKADRDVFNPYADPVGSSQANVSQRKTLKGVFNYITKYIINC